MAAKRDAIALVAEKQLIYREIGNMVLTAGVGGIVHRPSTEDDA